MNNSKMNVFVGVIKMQREIDMEMEQARENFKIAIEIYKEQDIFEKIMSLPFDTIILIYLQIAKYLKIQNIKRRHRK